MLKISRRHSLGLLGGVAAAATLGRPAFAKKRITVGALRFTSHAASFVAFERGYFADAGLEVTFKFFQAAQPMAVAIASGDVDYGVTAISGGLISLADKGAVKVIGGALSEEAGIDGQKYLVSDAAFKAGATRPALLAGKSYGMTQAGSSFHYMGSKLAKAEGVELKFKPLQKVGAIIGALKSGQIDAWSIVPHIAKPLTSSGKAHIIGSVSHYIPDYQVTTLFTSTRNAEDEIDQTEAFVEAFSRGAADFNAALVDKTESETGRDAMVDLIHKYVYADKPREKAARSIINGAMRINTGAALRINSVIDQLNWFKSEGLVKDRIKLETLLDTRYVKEI